MSTVQIVDIIGNIVTKVRAEYDPATSLKPYYLYGHPLEIINILAQKDSTSAWKYKKYPLICLFQDFEESMDYAENGLQGTSDINIVICTQTDPNYIAAERYADTFDSVLYPLYDLFIKYFNQSTEIENEHPSHTKIDRLYWGRSGLYGNEGNMFNDFIDAIELQNLNIEVITQNC